MTIRVTELCSACEAPWTDDHVCADQVVTVTEVPPAALQAYLSAELSKRNGHAVAQTPETLPHPRKMPSERIRELVELMGPVDGGLLGGVKAEIAAIVRYLDERGEP